jgi:hypothetical protein
MRGHVAEVKLHLVIYDAWKSRDSPSHSPMVGPKKMFWWSYPRSTSQGECIDENASSFGIFNQTKELAFINSILTGNCNHTAIGDETLKPIYGNV